MARIIVAGGGIGGLAAALGVSRRGHDVVVLERRRAFEELGASIQLAPNAFWALDRLGVGADVRDKAVFIDELRFMDGTSGACVARMPLTGSYRARFHNPYAVVHRGDLYEPLLRACRAAPRVELVTGASATGYTQDGGAVTVALADGSSVAGDALIGADGIRSAIRAQLVGDGEPRVSGHTIYRSVIPMEQVPRDLRWNAVTLWAGPKWHFVHYTIGGGRYLNLAATRDDGATVAVAGEPVERAHVLSEFPDLGDTARRLLELGEEWRTWVLCDRDPVGDWTDGRVALLGDAAHPMLQYAAQGACMALEDAVVLGGLLDCDAHAIAPRLEKYAAARRARTARAQLVAREMGTRLYHPAGDQARARNAMLSAFSVTDLYDEVDWLHGFGPSGGPTGGSVR
ncbi:3-hydroxybenzoate 6-monooxygenase [Thermomonospora umbrina]|uniref:3-hydroxybenzoate 6-hydroxylase n=1 Tax=Thermomonospora umbrina TaxID=111806 RepID=A0A3D9SUM9_9ACTN|nr:3-hydroxybenzoate 6-monooxygenase [Thermomonospora umbrina]REE99646.1 3-hydroxybenzoate 6-hydroxylase [Thermomonospora umbrina]